MKRIFILLFVAFWSFSADAQLDLKKASTTASALGFDPVKIGKSIMDQLTPKLGLSADQVTKVSGLVGQFLTNKSSYMSLMQTKPAEYQTKFNADQKTLFSGLQGALKPAQYTQFLGLKPKQADNANAISQLFY